MTTTPSGGGATLRQRVAEGWASNTTRAVALSLALLAVYASSIGGDFLNYDDGWLIVDNPLLDLPFAQALKVFFSDFSRVTRLRLGAEYLPLRDLSLWLDVTFFGRSAQAMRAVQLGFYLIAALAFRESFVRTLGAARGELVAWLFALHPVHVESVAWLAGRKDVLAMAFMGLCLWRHTVRGRDGRVSVPLLWMAACLSKSMSVGLIGPLLAIDLCLRRRPDARTYGLSGALVGLCLWTHLQVGRGVGMLGGPLSAEDVSAWISMGPVWLAYASLVVDASALSVRHDVQLLSGWTAEAAAGWLLLLGTGVASLIWAWRGRGEENRPDHPLGTRLGMVAWLWFAVPLGPVSQVLAPLQNVWADRYLWLSVAGPLVVAVHLDRWARAGVIRPLLMAWCVVLSGTTALRAPLFADSVRLFEDATLRTIRDPVAPYQLGKALETRGDEEGAMAAFDLTLQRCKPDSPSLPRATNNLAKLLAKRGRLPEARAVLQRGLAAQPNQQKMRDNLRKLQRGMEEPLDSTEQSPQ